ncbi:MAG: DUF2079 domain-containing protein [Propionibacteriaceae bacterium]|nr:DUF2079 domain-containing protein [Propionibacteriaceae bacterium]
MDNAPDPSRLKDTGHRAWGWWPMWVVTIGCFGAYLALSLGRWRRQAAPSWDLAIFEQAVKGWAYTGVPIIDIKGPGVNQLGDHFSPLLAVLAPFYRLFPGPVTLLVAQCVLIAISIPAVMMIARRLLGAAPALFLGIAYGISWGFQSGIDVQFHEYALAVPLLAFSMWAYLSHRWVLTAILAVLLLGVKEDLGLSVIALGVLMLARGIRHWSHQSEDAGRQVVTGIATIVVGIVGTMVILFVVIPAFNGHGVWDYWGRLAGDGHDISAPTSVGTAVGNLPGLLLGLFTPAAKVNTLVLLVALSIGSCVFSPLGLVAVPTLLWRFVSPDNVYWGTSWHYSMILMPIIFMAAIDALRKLRGSPSRHMRRYTRLVPVLACAFGLVTCLTFPLKNIVDPASYEPPPRAGEASDVLALMPSSTSVATDMGLITQLVTDHTVYWVGSLNGVVPDYLLVDPLASWSSDPGDPAVLAEAYYPGTIFTTIYDQTTSGDPNGYRLAKHDT